MAIIFNGGEIKDATCKGTQLDKVTYNGVTVYEAWKPWSKSIRNPSSGWLDHSTSQVYDYTIPSNVKVTYAFIRSSTNGENTGTWVGIDGWNGSSWVEIVRVDQKNWDQSVSKEWPSGCPYSKLRFKMGGRTLQRYHTIEMSGLQK